MDETKDTQENSLQESGKASEGSEGTTPPEEAKTQYTQEELDKALQADRIKRGRDDKSLSGREAAVKSQEESVKARLAKIEEWERQQDAAELAEAQRDPDKLVAYQAKQAERNRGKSLDAREAELKKREAEQDRREAENAETVKAAEQHQMEMSLWEIAAEAEINQQTLKDGVKELNLTTVEQAKALAKRLKPTGERPPEGEVEGGKVTPIPVPTTGGSHGTPTLEQRGKQSMEDYAAQRKKEEPDKFPL